MLGALIGAGASLIGGMLGNKSAESAAAKNAAQQKEFAQNSIQWKAADSLKAGIHPLYGIGAPTYAPAPSYAGDSSMGNAMASAGQDIGRAITASSTKADRMVSAQAASLELERAGLQNDLLRAQIAETQTRATGSPPFPAAVDPYLVPGQGNSPLKVVPMERINNAHSPWSEPAGVSSVGWMQTDSGGWVPVPSKDAKDRIEDSPYEWEHWVRNRLGPIVRYHKNWQVPISRGTAEWDPFTGEYRYK